VHDSYPTGAARTRSDFPTGIALEQHAVAIPTARRYMRNLRLST
jgi:hypothetical protein